MPRLAWMLTNSVWPSGENVDPANSSPNRGSAGQLADQTVQCDVPELSAAGQSADVVVDGAVLADDERPAGTGRDVVGEVEPEVRLRGVDRGLVEDLQLLRAAVIRPHLAVAATEPVGVVVVGVVLLRAAALGRGEVDDVVVVDLSLEPGEERSALRTALVADRDQRRVVGGRSRLARRVREGRVRVRRCRPTRRRTWPAVGCRASRWMFGLPLTASICSRPSLSSLPVFIGLVAGM